METNPYGDSLEGLYIEYLYIGLTGTEFIKRIAEMNHSSRLTPWTLFVEDCKKRKQPQVAKEVSISEQARPNETERRGRVISQQRKRKP